MKRRLATAFLAGALASLALGAAPAAAVSCGSLAGPFFAGMEQPRAGSIRGALAKIEYVPQALCAGSPPTGTFSFTSQWVSVVGYDSRDINNSNIYQVGYDRCKDPGCPNANDVPYYFYAYGHMQSVVCGSEIFPEPVKAPLGNADNATYWFRVEKVGTDYILKIAGSEQNRRDYFSLEVCWSNGEGNGVDAVQIMNEVGNSGDQSGGSVGNKQFFSETAWKDTVGWHDFNEPYSAPCDVAELGHQGCRIASNLHDAWYSWDSRFP